MDKLIVPVYLNQIIVFDLIAMLQGGISTVTSVNQSSNLHHDESQKASAQFGLNSAFSTLLKIDFSANKKTTNNNSQGKATSEERIHTPASLFYQLRNILVDKNVLKTIQENSHPQPGDFIEFEAILSKNPIIEALDNFSQLIELALKFEVNSSNVNKQKSAKPSELSIIKKQLDDLNTSLKISKTIDLTATLPNNFCKAVITCNTDYLSDPNMSNLADGKFFILAKVTRTVENDSESISLIRNTAISKMPKHILDQLKLALNNLSLSEGFVIPEVSWDIDGPVIQVIPVAIYA
ncbi:MAG: hypothetical protein BVN34_08200 [Proteobacteria bacterium ST_bin12]|nr:MAG: hypothetical protein BVN34_08200 [Proteobacteria bacterium ST_bin12]